MGSRSLPLVALLLLTACESRQMTAAPILGSFGVRGDVSVRNRGDGRAPSTFRELGLEEDNEAALGAMLSVDLEDARLDVSAYGVGYRGFGAPGEDLELEGITLDEGTFSRTDFDLQVAQGLYTWDLERVRGVDLGVGVGAQVIDMRFDIREQALPGRRIETSQVLPLPLVGGRAAWTWGPVDLRATASGMAMDYGGRRATVLQGEVTGAVELRDLGKLLAGYRLSRVDTEYDDGPSAIDSDVVLEGFFLGLRLRL